MALIEVSGGSLELRLPPTAATPTDVYAFLRDRGWWTGSDSTGSYFEKGGYHRMTWEQAMAIEFYQFITLGGR